MLCIQSEWTWTITISSSGTSHYSAQQEDPHCNCHYLYFQPRDESVFYTVSGRRAAWVITAPLSTAAGHSYMLFQLPGARRGGGTKLVDWCVCLNTRWTLKNQTCVWPYKVFKVLFQYLVEIRPDVFCTMCRQVLHSCGNRLNANMAALVFVSARADWFGM